MTKSPSAPPKPYIDYYDELGIVPVRQDVSDRALHFKRRQALYRHLKMPIATFRNSSVIEFGPGTGDNALFLNDCRPSRLTLVDNAQGAVEAIGHKLKLGDLFSDIVKFHKSDIMAYRDTTKYGVVLCESVLQNQPDPNSMLRHIASFAEDHGIVVATSADSVSLAAEICRRVIKTVFAERINSRKELISSLTTFFGPDLDSLPGMNKRHEDYVMDIILNEPQDSFDYPMEETILALADEFDVLGTSPDFLTDWRWYKSIPNSHPSNLQRICAQLKDKRLFFIDYRLDPSTIPPDSGLSAAVGEICREMFQIHRKIWIENSPEHMASFLESTKQLEALLSDTLPETTKSVASFQQGMKELLDGARSPDFGTFRQWFGRGQQYISFERRS